MSQVPLLTVRFFKTATGNEPVREWLRSDDINAEDRKIIGEDIKTIQYGWPMGMPIVEKLESDLWIIRTNGLEKGISRVFFTIQDNIMVLLHGFIKKTQKLPRQDIELARKRLAQLCD
jgi:phage-related protein